MRKPKPVPPGTTYTNCNSTMNFPATNENDRAAVIALAQACEENARAIMAAANLLTRIGNVYGFATGVRPNE